MKFFGRMIDLPYLLQDVYTIVSIMGINSQFRYAGRKFYARALILEHIPIMGKTKKPPKENE
jgi:hypothetical protein